MKAIATVVAVTAVLIVMLVVSVREYLSIPVAVFSHSSGQCVKLLQDGVTKTPCGKLPERYHVEWTQ